MIALHVSLSLTVEVPLPSTVATRDAATAALEVCREQSDRNCLLVPLRVLDNRLVLLRMPTPVMQGLLEGLPGDSVTIVVEDVAPRTERGTVRVVDYGTEQAPHGCVMSKDVLRQMIAA